VLRGGWVGMTDPQDGYVVGLVGADIGTSLSPPLHQREADELGIRYVYRLIDIDRLGMAAQDVGEVVAQAWRLGFAGLNITHPCKQVVVEHLDDLSAEAALLGAVNTVVFADGRAVGHNTDRSGFAEGFRRGLPGVPLGTVVLVGAGGAGAAVAHAMLGLGTQQLVVVDLEADRARRLARVLGGPSIVAADPQSLAGWLARADGLINATPVGMTTHSGVPIPVELLRPDMWVADIVYRPLRTELLRRAEALGCRTLNGGGMVVFQAAEAFHLFTGVEPDADRMYRNFAELVEETVRVVP
jgi:quinate/shikimate dehydrogenase (NAD+)